MKFGGYWYRTAGRRTKYHNLAPASLAPSTRCGRLLDDRRLAYVVHEREDNFQFFARGGQLCSGCWAAREKIRRAAEWAKVEAEAEAVS